jgi:hypothetical protein
MIETARVFAAPERSLTTTQIGAMSWLIEPTIDVTYIARSQAAFSQSYKQEQHLGLSPGPQHQGSTARVAVGAQRAGDATSDLAVMSEHRLYSENLKIAVGDCLWHTLKTNQ